MNLPAIPGWSYGTSLAVYFTKHPEAKLSSVELCDVLDMDCSLDTMHTRLRSAIESGIVAKRRADPKKRAVVWFIGPVLARRLAL